MANLVCNRKAAAAALSALSAVLPRRTTIPVINMVKLSANGAVDLSATDLESSLLVSVPRLGGAGDAAVLLDGKRFEQYVRAQAGEDLEIAWDGPGQATLDGSTTFVTADATEFPTLPTLSGAKKLATVPLGELHRGLSQAIVARSEEVVRYALTGVLLELRKWNKKNSSAHLVASDGKRLSSRVLACSSIEAEASVILRPGMCFAIEKVAKTLRKEPGLAVEIWAEEGEKDSAVRLHFVIPGRIQLSGTTLDGRFPDWKAVTPTYERGNGKKVSIDSAALAAGIRKLEPAMTEKTRAFKMTFRPDGTLVLKAKTQDVGEVSVELPYKGQADLWIVFNPDYVLDFLGSLEKSEKEFTLGLESKDQAGLFIGRKGHQYVLMPLTISL